MFRRLIEYGLGSFFGALIGLALTLLLVPAFVLGKRLVNLSYDVPFTLRNHIPVDEVVLIYMDEESHEALQQPYDAPWDRSKTHARLLERLKADGAQAAILDIFFAQETTAEADAHFAQAMTNFGKVIIVADETPLGYGRVEGASQIQVPYEPIAGAAASLGVATITPDYDSVVRQHTPIDTNSFVRPLSWAAAELLGAAITQNPEEWAKQRWVKYYGPAAWIPNVSYYRALDTNDIAPGFFKNKVVFVGSRLLTKSSGEQKDEYRTPYSLAQSGGRLFIPGAEVQATMFLNLMRQDWLTRLPKWPEIGLLASLGALVGFGLSLLRPFFATLVALVGIVIFVALGYYMVTLTNTWFAWAIVVVQIVVCCLWSVVFNSVRLHVQKRLIQQSLAMYVSPSRVSQILKSNEMLKPGATKQEVSILFSDIANFTTMSEGMDSDELARMMNGYFESAVGGCIHKAEGTVVKFIGDAIFAIWNAPEQQANHQELACRGGLLLRDQVTGFKGSKPGLEVRTRIGLHTGPANVGNFGSSTRVDYTAIGENINLASRMEGLNKYLGTDVLITGEVEAAVRGKFIARYLGQFILKGFEKTVEVYELLGFPEDAEKFRQKCDGFAAGLEAFYKQDWRTAEARFKALLEKFPKDGPAKFYLKQIEEFRSHPPETDWAGEIELKEK